MRRVYSNKGLCRFDSLLEQPLFENTLKILTNNYSIFFTNLSLKKGYLKNQTAEANLFVVGVLDLSLIHKHYATRPQSERENQ